MATVQRPNVAGFYERDVLPALMSRLDQAFPEFGWGRDAHGWVATSAEYTRSTLGARPDRVVCCRRRLNTGPPTPVEKWTAWASSGVVVRLAWSLSTEAGWAGGRGAGVGGGAPIGAGGGAVDPGDRAAYRSASGDGAGSAEIG